MWLARDMARSDQQVIARIDEKGWRYFRYPPGCAYACGLTTSCWVRISLRHCFRQPRRLARPNFASPKRKLFQHTQLGSQTG